MSVRCGRWWWLVIVVAMLAPAGGARGQTQVATRGPRFVMAGSGGGGEGNASDAAVLRRRVSLELNGVTIDQALKALTDRAGLEISYSPHLVGVERTVTLRARDITVAAALTEILLDVPVDVSVTTGGHLALVQRARVPAPAPPDTGVVVGRVTDAQAGSPIVGATVSVDGTRASATTGADGRYRIGGLAAGPHTVRARYIGYKPVSQNVTVGAGEEATADFALAKSAQELDQVVVTGTIVPTEVKALPTPVSVISESDIGLQRPRTLGQVFREAVPSAVGWDLGSDPTTTLLSVRGASSLSPSSAGMKVYIDGIEVANRGYAAIDPASIERVEVIRGPQAATIYGSDAIGGVIQVFTKRGDSTRARVQVDASTAVGALQTPYTGYAAALYQRYSASARGAGAHFSYNLGGSYSRFGDWIPEGAQSLPSLYGGVHAEQGSVSLDLSARYYQQNRTASFNPLFAGTGFAYFSKPSYQEYRFREQTLGARLTWAPTSWFRQYLAVGVDRFSLDGDQTQPRLTTPADTFLFVYDDEEPKTFIAYNASVSGNVSPTLMGSVTTGVDHYDYRSTVYSSFDTRNTEGTIGGTVSGDRSEVTNTGYFAQAQLTYRSALSLTAGVRAEQNSSLGNTFGTHASPRVGLAYAATRGVTTLKVRASYGEGIRPPGPGLSQNKVYGAGSFQLANAKLGPEKQTGWDAGLDLAVGSHASLSATYYDQVAEDLIQQVLVGAGAPLLYQFQNVGRVRNRGLELEGTLDLRAARIRGQFAVADSRVETLAPGYTGDLRVGDRPLALPKYTAGASITLLALPRMTMTGGLTYVGNFINYDYLAQFACYGGTAACRGSQRDYLINYPGFVKIDVSVTRQLTPWLSGFVTVQNVGNNGATEYANTIAIMGRLSMVGMEVEY
jgi:outer membrane receptor protein involved in Fe transport